jgi:hypothetical protein
VAHLTVHRHGHQDELGGLEKAGEGEGGEFGGHILNLKGNFIIETFSVAVVWKF